MKDTLTRGRATLPTFWIIQIAGWFCFYLSVVVIAVPQVGLVGFWGAAAFVVTTFVASCLLRPVCRSLMLRARSWLALEALAFAYCVPFGIVAGIVSGLLAELRVPNWVDWLQFCVQASIMLFVWCSLYISLELWQQSLQEQERLLRAEADVRNARLSALRYQLNPHFLFNSLNAVSTLVLEGDAPAATHMLTQVAEFMRSVFDGDASPETTLAREIAHAEQYLAIEQTRLGERMHLDTTVAPESLEALVPTMLLQPLVENAVRHGIAPLVEGGTIRIVSETRGSKLRITVWNSGAPQAMLQRRRNGTGVGLSNTEARLKALYGLDHLFTSQSGASGDWEVTVEVPLRLRAAGSERLPCEP